MVFAARVGEARQEYVWLTAVLQTADDRSGACARWSATAFMRAIALADYAETAMP